MGDEGRRAKKVVMVVSVETRLLHAASQAQRAVFAPAGLGP
jgi:hypothetical protein